MIDPARPAKQLWDLLVIAAIGVTGIEIPARIALGYPLAGWTRALDLGITLVFALDIAISFRTARRARGRLDRDPRSVASSYLRGWFATDLVSAVPVATLLGGAAPPGLLLLRMARVLKLPVLRRSLRVWEAAHFADPNLVRLGFLAGGVLMLSHWVACGWILVAGGSGGAAVPYVDALYWSVTTLTTVGYGDITPAASAGKIYTMAVMFVGVAMWATIIGAIAGLIRNLDHARTDHNERMDRVNTFMRYHELPADLRRRIRDHHEYLWASRLGMNETELAVDLPPHLRADVSLHLMRDMLSSVPLFRHATPELLRLLAARLEPCTYGPGEYIVRRGEIGHRMFFIDRGSAEVLSVSGVRQSTLAEGSYFGEIALLYDNRRSVSVRAIEFCDLYALERAHFEGTIHDFPDFAREVQRVAQERAARPLDDEADPGFGSADQAEPQSGTAS